MNQKPATTQSFSAVERRYLLLDKRIVAAKTNVDLSVGAITKHPANPLFIEDKPWEQRFDNLYGNIIYDAEERLYKCWYSPFIISNRCYPDMSLQEPKATPYTGRKDMEMGICYAVSKDGLNWDKPDLNAVEYDGDTQQSGLARPPWCRHPAGRERA